MTDVSVLSNLYHSLKKYPQKPNREQRADFFTQPAQKPRTAFVD
jgi:hypothetical protein